MKRVNPLYIVLALFLLVVVLFVKLEALKEEIAEEKAAYLETKKTAEELLAYKKLFGNKNYSALKHPKVQLTQKGKHLHIESKSITLSALNSLMRKLLNGSYIIEKLRIEKIDDKHASVVVEVQL